MIKCKCGNEKNFYRKDKEFGEGKKHIGIYCQSCDNWITWEAQDMDNWREFKMSHTKHEGKTIGQIMEIEPSYIQWGADNFKGSLQKRFEIAKNNLQRKV